MQQSNRKLVSIELNNFESFYGTHMIGPLTTLTAIIGPNGGGKSNLLDAVAFALALPLPRGKYTHVKDLVYKQKGSNQSNNDVLNGMVAAQEESQQLSTMLNMYVKLNFDGGLSLRRSYAIRDQVSEFCVIERSQETPLTSDEYKTRVRELHLNIGDFCVYQDRLLAFTKMNLNEIFERLSGSIDLKDEYERLSQHKLSVEHQLREVSESLKEKKHEKVKVKGLGEYQKQIEACIAEQKQVTELLAIVDILSREKQMEKLQKEAGTLKNSVDQTYELRQAKLQDYRRIEQAVRRAENQCSEKQKMIKQLRTDLTEIKDSQMSHDQKVRASQQQLVQKQKMLTDFTREHETANKKVQKLQSVLSQSETNFKRIREMIEESPALQKQQELREEYLEIRSALQTDNASIERQICKLESQLQQLAQLQSTKTAEIKKLEGQIAAATSLPQLQSQMDQVNTKTRQNERELKKAQELLAALKEKSQTQRKKIQEVERELLEAGFELTELECEKRVKSSDARISKFLKELKGRCRGYHGQLFELVKPINAQYDTAVKVALRKCLKFLVVNTAESAQIVNDFLREKQITRDVLILANVPDRSFSRGLQARLEGAESTCLVYDVIDISKKDPLIERAVRYFTADKVVTKTFEMAARLQSEKSVKDLVTEDGTEFKQGMISGGHHANVFNLSLGTAQLDSKISKAVDWTQKLERDHASLKQELNDEVSAKETQALRQVSAIELELESLRDKKGAIGRQILALTETNNEQTDSLNENQTEADRLAGRHEELRAQKAVLQEEGRATEKKAFNKFCKRAKVKEVAEFEAQLFSRKQHSGIEDENGRAASAGALTPEQLNERGLPEGEGALLASKFDFENAISKTQADLSFNEQELEHQVKNLQAIETSVVDEKQKLENLRGEARHADLDNKIEKMQEEYRSLDETLLTAQKEMEKTTAKRTSLRNELDTLATRDEVLQKDKNSGQLKLKELGETIKELIETAVIDKSIEFEEDEGFDLQGDGKEQAITQLYELLNKKGDFEEGQQPKATEQLQSLHADYARKVRELEDIEDKFNQCVAIIPETDESTMKLTREIMQLKEQLDGVSKSFGDAKDCLNKVRVQRKDKFLNFFDRISAQLPANYRELTKAAGTASLLVSDRVERPFESPIIFDFCPPGKRHGVDLEMLSGGEKTMAGLAFIFAMVQVIRPPLLIMDEVDAYLDADNVAEISAFLHSKLNCFSQQSGQATQMLCVSHKEDLAQQMDSLIGVCMMEKYSSSKAFTVDLSNLK